MVLLAPIWRAVARIPMPLRAVHQRADAAPLPGCPFKHRRFAPPRVKVSGSIPVWDAIFLKGLQPLLTIHAAFHGCQVGAKNDCRFIGLTCEEAVGYFMRSISLARQGKGYEQAREKRRMLVWLGQKI